MLSSNRSIRAGQPDLELGNLIDLATEQGIADNRLTVCPSPPFCLPVLGKVLFLHSLATNYTAQML